MKRLLYALQRPDSRFNYKIRALLWDLSINPPDSPILVYFESNESLLEDAKMRNATEVFKVAEDDITRAFLASLKSHDDIYKLPNVAVFNLTPDGAPDYLRKYGWTLGIDGTTYGGKSSYSKCFLDLRTNKLVQVWMSKSGDGQSGKLTTHDVTSNQYHMEDIVAEPGKKLGETAVDLLIKRGYVPNP